MFNDLLGFIYFFLLVFGPYILLILSVCFLGRAYLKNSTASVLASFLLFLPDLLALLLLPLEPFFYIFLVIPVLQAYLYVNIKKGWT